MNGFLKPVVLSLAAASIALAPVSQAAAGERWKKPRHPRHHQPVIVQKHDTGELLAAGIIGLALGAIIVGAANSGGGDYVHHPVRPRPDRDYFPQRPNDIDDDDEPEVVYFDEYGYGAPEPWTREWFRYCTRRYRSFNHDNGTYMGYDGKRHFCVAK